MQRFASPGAVGNGGTPSPISGRPEIGSATRSPRSLGGRVIPPQGEILHRREAASSRDAPRSPGRARENTYARGPGRARRRAEINRRPPGGAPRNPWGGCFGHGGGMRWCTVSFGRAALWAAAGAAAATAWGDARGGGMRGALWGGCFGRGARHLGGPAGAVLLRRVELQQRVLRPPPAVSARRRGAGSTRRRQRLRCARAPATLRPGRGARPLACRSATSACP